jgi:hypothetical protein
LEMLTNRRASSRNPAHFSRVSDLAGDSWARW